MKAGKELGHYKIIRKLGSGGMADVYEAEDMKLGRRVALKILPPELMRNPQLIARFQTEVRAAASLNHRSIVTVFEVGEQDDIHFYSMRLLTGGDLRGKIQQGLRGIEALAILRELAGAFEHAHGRGFVHRDVKPENVLFDEEGLPVLTDFGIAKALGGDSHLTGTGVSIGTPRYFSPEQARGRPVDARADIYSLGVMLYEMLTGQPPYDGEETLAIVLKHVSEPIPELPEEYAYLQPLLESLMAKDPNQRMASAKDLRKAITAVAGLGGNTPPPINLGDESELVQRLLTGEEPAYRTPAPVSPAPVSKSHTPTIASPRPGTASGDDETVRRAPPQPERPAAKSKTPGGLFSVPASSSPSEGGGEAYEVADEDEDATIRRAPPPRKGETVVSKPSPSYQPQVVSPPRRPEELKPASSGSGTLKWIAAGAVLIAGAGGAFVMKKGPGPEAAKPVEASAPATTAPATQAPTSQAAAPQPAQAPAPAASTAAVPAQAAPVAVAPQPRAAAPAPSRATPAARAPAPAPAQQAAKTAPAPAPAPAPAAATVAPAQAAPTPAPTPAPVAHQPAAAPTEAPVAHAEAAPKAEAKPEPKPEPKPEAPKPVEAKPKPAPAPAKAEPAESADEDDFLKQRAEQLKLERERREAAKKKAAEQALKQNQAPASDTEEKPDADEPH